MIACRLPKRQLISHLTRLHVVALRRWQLASSSFRHTGADLDRPPGETVMFQAEQQCAVQAPGSKHWHDNRAEHKSCECWGWSVGAGHGMRMHWS